MTEKEPRRKLPSLPSKDDLRKFIHASGKPLNKRDIARAFYVRGEDRARLRAMLRELAEEGGIEKTSGKVYAPQALLPEIALIEIIGLDGDGEMRAKPVNWQGKGAMPIIYVIDKKRSEGYLSAGDQVQATLKRTEINEYEARILRAVDPAIDPPIIGVYKTYKGNGYVYPTNKKIKEDYFIPAEYALDASEGDLVIAEAIPPSQKFPRSRNPARVVKRLGAKDDPRLISLIAIHAHGIPTEFSKAVLQEAEGMSEPDLSGGRVDIRHLPLVTIDGADARDFDDAVFAEPDTDPKNPGGWRLIVAIADVSYYVRPSGALDKSAFERGNSTYFADRVVPMLPEKLSNDLCSLRPHVNRACLAVRLRIDSDANLIEHEFFRGLMRSAARLTYEQVEDAHKGAPDDTTGPLMASVIQPLYKAYSLLKHARELRGALEIDLPERKAIIDAAGQVTAIVPRERLQSHQLIEEFMILANVAAAEALEEKKAPCVYRVHAPPSFDKLETTREFLKGMDYSLPKAEDLQPKNINHLLKLSADREDKELIHTVLLRTQSQAIYSSENIGHFGLALKKYAHFTSPIRRYADLLVHRSLIQACRLGDGGLTQQEADDLDEISEHITVTERRSMLAERDVMDRFTAQYLSHSIGKDFKGKISGVTRFGLFVSLADSGADGIVPMRSLPDDFYIHDEKRHALVGRKYGRVYNLAAPVVVRVREADPLRGSTVFELLDGVGASSRPPGKQASDRRNDKDKRSYRGRSSKKNRDKGKNKR